MNQENYISTLTPEEQKALAICGILKSEQLQRITADALYTDMQQAADHFREDFTPLSRQRLEEIFRAVGQSTEEKAPAVTNTQADDTIFGSNGEANRFLPPLVTRRGHRKISSEPGTKRPDTINLAAAGKEHVSNKSNAICSTHPFRTYFSALVHIALVATIILFLTTAVRLILGIGTAMDIKIAAALAGASIAIFIMYTSKTKCPVCNMNILSMHNYPRNKHAHYFPLLGYTLSTALHIIFLFWFRCPACGTSQKFFKRKRR